MTVQELIDRLKNVNPDADIVLVNVNFDSYTIEDNSFTENCDEEVTIYIDEANV